MKKVYLAGPMTGYPNLNYPAFRVIAENLRNAGYEVYNPAEWIDEYKGSEFNHILAFSEHCKDLIRKADVLLLLPGWMDSEGAKREVHYANIIGTPVTDKLILPKRGAK